jgi:dsDNA-specific endonuclease/ATPase MutS2
VREILAGFCQTDMGRERALALEPVADGQQIASELDRLDEVAIAYAFALWATGLVA